MTVQIMPSNHLCGVVTCARPQELQVALQGWNSVQGGDPSDSRPLVVLDDEDPARSGAEHEQARQVVSRWHASGRPAVGYAGRREKEAMAALLQAGPELAETIVCAGTGPASRDGAVPGGDLARFALLGDGDLMELPPRTNRNALILLGAGGTAVGLDEDLRWAVSAEGRTESPAADSHVWGGNSNLRDLHLRSDAGLLGAEVFPSREELTEAHPPAPWDLDAALRAPLGWRPRGDGHSDDRVGHDSQPFHLEHASPLLNHRFHAGELRVAVTMYPLWGHSGSSSSHYRLFLAGDERTRLVEGGGEAYGALRNSVWEYRGRPHATLTDAGFFMHAASGYDLTQVVPPYLPHLSRGGDAVFAALLTMTSPGASVLILPRGVHHEGPEVRRFDSDSIWKGGGDWNLARLILMLLSSLAFPHGMPRKEREAALVAPIRAAGAASPPALEEQVRAHYRGFLDRRLRALDAIYEEYGGYPRWWAEDVERAMDHMEGLLREGGQPLPAEFSPAVARGEAPPPTQGRSGEGPASNWLRLGELMRRYADLLEAWPAIFQAAQRLRSELWREVAGPA